MVNGMSGDDSVRAREENCRSADLSAFSELMILSAHWKLVFFRTTWLKASAQGRF